MEFVCLQCPRECNVVRNDESGTGYCGSPALPRIARAALHFWEEPCISGKNGSGTIFFSGCSLRCAYCQNYSISHENFGKTVSLGRLSEIISRLSSLGAHNINLVNPTHYSHLLPYIKENCPPELPVVYNTSGYEKAESLNMINGCVDIYLTDIKYMSGLLSEKYSSAGDYFLWVCESINEMIRQTGEAVFDENGLLKRGVIIRHLILPGYSADSINILKYCRDNLPDGIIYSIMSQYTPMGDAKELPPLNRRLNAGEYARVKKFLESDEKFKGYIQELSSAKEEYIPQFDLTGV